MYGTTGTVTEEVKQAVESLSKNARTKVWTHISGGGGRSGNEAQLHSAESSDAGSLLLAIKKEADEFYKELKEGKHRYRRLYVSNHHFTGEDLTSRIVLCYGNTQMSRILILHFSIQRSNLSTIQLRVER